MPSAARLEATALHLASRGELRTLVSMVERWSQVGEPTPRAVLAQIDALLSLGLMDRAWSRLQSLPEEDAWGRDKAALTARMFLDRGWPRRARTVLEEAVTRFPIDDELTSLLERSDQPPRRAPASDPDPEAPYADQLAVAETWLATGAFLKARRLLEFLQRRYPQEARVGDLLWALKGDFELTNNTLQALANLYVPAQAFDLPDLPEDPEPTDMGTPSAADALGDAGTGNFPALFEGSERDADERGDEGDVTITTRLSDLQRNHEIRLLEDREEDTEVLRVISSQLVSVTKVERDKRPTHADGEVGDEIEGEDEAVVQLTRPADRQPPHQVVKPKPLPDPGPPRKLPPPPKPKLHTAPQPPPPPEPAAPAPDELPPLPAWLLPAAAALGVAGVLIGAVAMWSMGVFGGG